MSASSFLGKYQILSELGKGGFATVYRARDPDLGREVALKVLDPLLTRDPVWVARFRREAWTVASLDHPRVVAIYEIGQAEGTLYIAMKLVEGGSLKQRIEMQGRLPWDDIVRLTGQIAETLDFAHAQGVLHRDLKPANVLLDPQFGAVLTDFGFARLMTDNSMSISMSGGVVGTPTYIAPELWEDKEPSRQTDVYALGCMIYELVTGQALFTGSSTPAVMRAHFQPRKLPEVWPEGTPARLNDILLTALAQDPNGRYATAGELAAALVALRDDPLVAPYAALQEAMAQGRWPEALALAGQVRSVDAGYRDVAALEAMALARLERMERVKQAAGWRAEAEQALADGDFKGAELALQKWQGLTPDDVDCVEFRKKLTQEVRVQESATTAQFESEGEDQQPLSIVAPSGGPPPNPKASETEPTRNGRRRTWLSLALGAVALLAIIVLWPRDDAQDEPAITPQPAAAVTSTSVPQDAVTAVNSTATATRTAQASDTPRPTITTPSATWTIVPAIDTPTTTPAAPVPTPTSTARPTSPIPTRTPVPTATRNPLRFALVTTTTANLRNGPNMGFGIAGSYAQGTELEVLGRNSEATWLKVEAPDGTVGWMAISVLQPGGAVRDIQVVSAPPTPTPRTTTSTGSGSSGSTSSRQGCYLFENQLGAEVTITFTSLDRNWNATLRLPVDASNWYCLDPGRYTYTLDAPPPWNSINGDLVVSAGDQYRWPIRGQ